MIDKERLLKGRASHINPPNRFEPRHVEADWEQIEADEETQADLIRPKPEYLPDNSQSIVATNDSPDVGFRWSVNPYRGCSHGCAYCYARPGHEYLGLGAGLDFETKIMVKHRAAELLREFLGRPNWNPEVIVFSGVTDCYQPAEREFKLTRSCLEVALEARQPIGIITKNALVTRDLDLLRPMAAANLVHVNLSITTLDANLARGMEPRTSVPAARLRAIEALSKAGVPAAVMIGPVIPGLNDSEIPAILAAAAQAGARGAGYVVLRLPWSVRPVFLEWLGRIQPQARQRVEAAIRSVRGGAMNSTEWRERQMGTGARAEQIEQMFRTFKKKFQLEGPLPAYDFSQFRPPKPSSGQLPLF
ncbi:MAG TPA: PA0069 family radical SAM protein [Pirellulales bacterium]|nr:PA0069 family radical SAM protein [Pirellulales bacterium]